MNLIKHLTDKLANPDLSPQSRQITQAILDEFIRLNAEIAVKDMAIADRNKECADLYVWIEEAETFMYEQSRRKVREGKRE